MKAHLVLAAMAATAFAAPQAHAGAVGALATFARANHDLQTAITTADAANATPPSLADPDAADMIRTAFDVGAAEAAPTDNLGQLMEICSAAHRSLQAYALFGLRRAGVDAQTPRDQLQAAMVRVVGQNAVRFQDETAMALRFSVACTGKEIPATEQFMSALSASDWTPERRAGLQQMRRGMASVVTGVVLMQADPIRADNRAVVLDEGLKYVDAYAAALAPDDRQRVIAEVDRVSADAAVTDEVKAKLGRVKLAMSRTDCTALCAN